ncbi:MAG: serine/threonine protein kinase, partial [Actinomycetia bacterium]|nr:serine/threonine protein kinase [Actinomycetes bacterium]
LVAACLERVPRDRPTNAAILAGLSPFAIPASADHAYLPDSALALIGDYQHGAHGLGLNSLGQNSGSPSSPGRNSTGRNSYRRHGPADADDSSDAAGDEESASWATDGSGALVAAGADGGSGATSGSHTALPGFESPDAFLAGQKPPADVPWGPGRLLARARRPRLVLAVMVVGLLAAGAGIGIALDGPVSQALGPVTPPPAACTAVQIMGKPELCVSQPSGDSDTVFVLHGSGFPPSSQVTVRLVDGRTSRTSEAHPPVDGEGTFNYAIDQGHEFFRGAIPIGTYTAVASTPDGSSASASFEVHLPPIPGPPPGAGIPSGVPPGSGVPPNPPPGT